MKIYVLGDAFYDHYIVGKIRGMSAEAPIPIVDKTGEITLPGGAGNVLANLVGLGADAVYLERVQQNYPVKTRLMTQDGQQLARLDQDDWCRPYERGDLVGLLEADAIIVSDYGKGSVSEEVIQILRQVTLPVFVDTKGDPSGWIGSDAIMFPNMEEYKRYEEKYNWFPRVVLKRGADGLSLLEFGSVVLSRPAQSKFVQSVNGAGDTVIAAFALASLAGLTAPECLSFANAAAANVVEQPFSNRWTTSPLAVERMELNETTAQCDNPFESKGTGAVSRFGLYGDLSVVGLQGQQGQSRITLPDGEGHPAGGGADVSGAQSAVDVQSPEIFVIDFGPWT